MSCEIGNLIDVICEKSGKNWDDIEILFFDLFIYPEGRKTYLTSNFGDIVDGNEFLNSILLDIFTEYGIESIYVTEAI